MGALHNFARPDEPDPDLHAMLWLAPQPDRVVLL